MEHTEEERNIAISWWRCLSLATKENIFRKYKNNFSYPTLNYLSVGDIANIYAVELVENNRLLEQLTPEEQIRKMFQNIPLPPPLTYSWA